MPSTAGRRTMPGSWPPRSPSCPGHETQPVAGYDLTFSPVKSCQHACGRSPTTADRGHDRTCPPRGRRATPWRSSRSTPCTPGRAPTGSGRSTSAAWSRPRSPTGTPAPGTRTCTPMSRSRTRCRPLTGAGCRIDGRILFKANVAASETYNTALENHLRDQLGRAVRRTAGTDPRKRPVREIVGVDPALNAALVRPPRSRSRPAAASWRPRSSVTTAARRRRWRRSSSPSRPPWRPATPSTNPAPSPSNAPPGGEQAVEVLGGPQACRPWSPRALPRNARASSPAIGGRRVGARTAAAGSLAAMEERRSTWQIWHVRAEAQRQVRAAEAPTEHGRRSWSTWVAEVLDTRSVSLARPDDGIDRTGGAAPPRRVERLHRRRLRPCSPPPASWPPSSGSSTPPAAATARRRTCDAVELALLEQAANGVTLNPGQAALVRPDGHLRGPAPAGHRARRGRENHRHARPAAAWTEAAAP